MRSKPIILVVLATVCSVLGYLYIGYGIDRSAFISLIGVVGGLFLIYLMAVRLKTTASNLRLLIVMGVLARLSFLLADPELSDDYYRFLWDGDMLVHGQNPYVVLPDSFASKEVLSEDQQVLYDNMNSREYFTVYPPLNQGVFAIGAAVMQRGGIAAGAIAMRVILILFELLTLLVMIRILRAVGMEAQRAMWYWLNPLVIIEITGNLHFEGSMCLCIILMFGAIVQRQFFAAGVWAGIGASLKLLPFMFIPSVVRSNGWVKAVLTGIVATTLFTILLVPFISSEWIGSFSSSIDLYFRKFEFNAGIYFLVREIGFAVKGWNIIEKAGPWMGGISMLGIVMVQLLGDRSRVDHFFTGGLLAISIYLALTTTVHPWYVITPVCLSVFTRWRYPIVWSALAFLSYGAYRGEVYDQNETLVYLEYALLLVFVITEVVVSRKRSSSSASSMESSHTA